MNHEPEFPVQYSNEADGPTEVNICVWYQTNEGGADVNTHCGKDFAFNEDTELNDTAWMRYCCFCGRRARVELWPDSGEEE